MYTLSVLSSRSAITKAKSLKCGDLAKVICPEDETLNGMIVLRTMDRIVSLTDPSFIWEPTCDWLTVGILPSGSEVVLVVKEVRRAADMEVWVLEDLTEYEGGRVIAVEATKPQVVKAAEVYLGKPLPPPSYEDPTLIEWSVRACKTLKATCWLIEDAAGA